MKHFADLFIRIDQSNKTNEKIDALAQYLRTADEADKLWAIALFSDRRPRRTVNTTQLRTWAAEVAGLPDWLFEESYHVVGDLAETIALLLPPGGQTDNHSLRYWIHQIKQLDQADEAAKKALVTGAWAALDYGQRFIFNKLITGNWRVGVSGKLVAKAIAKASGLDENVVLHRLSGQWSADDLTYQQLILAENAHDDDSRPYPFCLAYALEEEVALLGAPDEWAAEYKWDGIRGQLIRRQGQLYVWSRGEELVTDKYPEYQALLSALPDGIVLDGEIIGWKEGRPLPFSALQTRIGRKSVSKKQLTETPVAFIAYDLLEYEGVDLREHAFAERRQQLEQLAATTAAPLHLSPLLNFTSWPELEDLRAQAPDHLAEGVMLKRLNSRYRAGRRKGDWWKWKLDPYTIDAVMIYAQQGHGRRANLFTDYTFAVWQGEALAPFTKAYSGLTDEEFRQVDAWIRKNTIERFGPVRSVRPELVFEIAFEGIQRSSRHKSGVALRFPRMVRWRKDKSAAEANTLEDLQKWLVP